MSIKIVFALILSTVPISSIQIPFIRDAIFVPLSKSNSTTITNYTCDQCLCMSLSSDLILNCLPNNTCQFFSNFPRTYKIQQTTTARLYFPQGIFPNASQCCMPNISYLLNQLNNAIPIYNNVSYPRCLARDNQGYIITISQTDSTILRFDPTNMTLISRTNSVSTTPMSLTYYNQNYYIGFLNSILVINGNNFTIRNNITSSYLNGTRDMLFLNNGNTLVVASTNNRYLLFFNRSSNVSTNYRLTYKQLVNYTHPHGLYPINDTYFYVTSWDYNTIYSYSAIQGSAGWSENLFLDARSRTNSTSGSHVTVDECGRFWFSLGLNGVKIFDQQGVWLGDLNPAKSFIFATMITDNYVIYLSDQKSNEVIRLDPNIQC